MEVDVSQIQAQYQMNPTQETTRSFQLNIRDYHPLWYYFPINFCLNRLRLKVALTTPHVLYISIKDSVCPLPLSLADNYGISIDFFSYGY